MRTNISTNDAGIILAASNAKSAAQPSQELAPPLVLDDALPRGLDVPLREARLAQQGPPRGRLEPPRRAVALRVAQARLLRPRGQRRAEPHGDAAAHGRRVAEPVVEVVDVQVAPGHAPAAGHASRVSSRRPRFSRREPEASPRPSPRQPRDSSYHCAPQPHPCWQSNMAT